MKFINIFIWIFIFNSCSSYIQKVHTQLDNELNPKKKPDSFSYFQQSKKYPNGVNSRNNRNVIPGVKRKYSMRKRHFKDADFRDSWSEGSLWAGDEKTNYFFSKDNFKKIGDLIIIQVQKILKQEIVLELERYSIKKMYQKFKKVAEVIKDPKAELEKKDPEEEDTPIDTKVYDKIPSMVVEQINQDHLFIKGRKDILYKKRKRLIEVQAIVARRNINDDDTIKSNDILESKVKILR